MFLKMEIKTTPTIKRCCLLNNTSSLNYKNSLYDHKLCAVCGCNGKIRKFNILFRYSHRARVCCNCINNLRGVENTATWLEKNAIFVNQNEFYIRRAVMDQIINLDFEVSKK